MAGKVIGRQLTEEQLYAPDLDEGVLSVEHYLLPDGNSIEDPYLRSVWEAARQALGDGGEPDGGAADLEPGDKPDEAVQYAKDGSGLDLSAMIERLRLMGREHGGPLAEQIVAMLDRYPFLRRQVDLHDLALLRWMAPAKFARASPRYPSTVPYVPLNEDGTSGADAEPDQGLGRFKGGPAPGTAPDGGPPAPEGRLPFGRSAPPDRYAIEDDEGHLHGEKDGRFVAGGDSAEGAKKSKEEESLFVDVEDSEGEDKQGVQVIKNPSGNGIKRWLKKLYGGQLKAMFIDDDLIVWDEEDVHHNPMARALNKDGGDINGRLILFLDKDSGEVKIDRGATDPDDPRIGKVVKWAEDNDFKFF